MKLNSVFHRSALAFAMWLCACSPQDSGLGSQRRFGWFRKRRRGGAGGKQRESLDRRRRRQHRRVHRGRGRLRRRGRGIGGKWRGGWHGRCGWQRRLQRGRGGSGGATGGSGGAGGSGSGGSGAGDGGAVEAPPAAGVDLLGKVGQVADQDHLLELRRQPDQRSRARAQTNQRNEDTFKGDPAKTYDVTFRVRGVVEPRIYDGGTPDPTSSPFVQVGGMPSNVTREHGVQYGVFRIEVSDPKQVYYLNKDHMNLKDHELYKLDFKLTVKVKGGATVSAVFSDRAGSGAIANHRNVVLEGVPSDVVMQPFKDQFMYIEGDTVIPAPERFVQRFTGGDGHGAPCRDRRPAPENVISYPGSDLEVTYEEQALPAVHLPLAHAGCCVAGGLRLRGRSRSPAARRRDRRRPGERGGRRPDDATAGRHGDGR